MKFHVVALLFLFSLSSFAQEKGYQIEVMSGIMMTPQSFPEVPDTIGCYNYDEVEVMPKPVEGWSAFYEMLEKLEYPVEAKKKNLETDVGVYFNIDRKGNLTKVKAYDKGVIVPERGQCEPCRLLVEKVIRDSKWTSGEIHGVKVNTKYDMIISFDIWEK